MRGERTNCFGRHPPVQTANSLEHDRELFEVMLDDLLRDHAGEYVLFKNGDPVSFFEQFEDAYDAGLDRWITRPSGKRGLPGLDAPYRCGLPRHP
jgi:hypothetical protein